MGIGKGNSKRFDFRRVTSRRTGREDIRPQRRHFLRRSDLHFRHGFAGKDGPGRDHVVSIDLELCAIGRKPRIQFDGHAGRKIFPLRGRGKQNQIRLFLCRCFCDPVSVGGCGGELQLRVLDRENPGNPVSAERTGNGSDLVSQDKGHCFSAGLACQRCGSPRDFKGDFFECTVSLFSNCKNFHGFVCFCSIGSG